MKNARIARTTATILVAVLAVTGAPAWSGSRDRCASIVTPWSVILPDGSTEPAGTMELCLNRMWTPVTGLHEIRVNGASLGLFMSRRGESEGLYSHDPLVVFQRTD